MTLYFNDVKLFCCSQYLDVAPIVIMYPNQVINVQCLICLRKMHFTMSFEYPTIADFEDKSSQKDIRVFPNEPVK